MAKTAARVGWYSPDSLPGRSLPPWERCRDCHALVLPDGHAAARYAPHDTDCRFHEGGAAGGRGNRPIGA